MIRASLIASGFLPAALSPPHGNITSPTATSPTSNCVAKRSSSFVQIDKHHQDVAHPTSEPSLSFTLTSPCAEIRVFSTLIAQHSPLPQIAMTV
ncbi:hypothetical protein PMG11_05439 [Penicillium brasilianum]|uniref:Uncharacterized protein n=1 Tax=Penicillium brasilianum TaxID=104259 RepID=A0A0F7VK87_PENBI|nr:hypothetical protein PMG11_05439 [Penicillium brasilianum]